MELWFIFAVLGALVGGLGAFGNKIAAQRKYSSILVAILNSAFMLAVFVPVAFVIEGTSQLSSLFIGLCFISGLFSSLSVVLKVEVLHHIDSAIFLPLFKVLGPLIVVVLGLIFFGESFSVIEWVGLLLSILVPILLVSRVESGRQNNLMLGLALVVVVSIVSAVVAGMQKQATIVVDSPHWIVAIVSLGVLVGALLQYVRRHWSEVRSSLSTQFSWGLVAISLLRAVFAGGGFYLTILALSFDGPLGIVYTINSLYILLPIVLAIIFYNEHWNLRKAVAITLSVVALWLLQ